MIDRQTVTVAKLAFRLSIFLAATAAIFGAGFYSSHSKNIVYRSLAKVQQSFQLVAQATRQEVNDEPLNFLQPARYSGDGVTIDSSDRPDDLILLAGFFDGATGLRLLRRNGEIVADWPAPRTEILGVMGRGTLRSQDWGVDLHGAVALENGSVVFNYEYAGTAKLDRCANVEWTNTEFLAHHSVERAESGGYWIPGRLNTADAENEYFLPFTQAQGRHSLVKEDLITRLSETGEIIETKSVPGIMLENGLGPLLSANGMLISQDFQLGDGGELVHLNKIAELKTSDAAAFPMFEAGDLLLSLRTHNLLFVVDPDTWKIKWHKIGPWLRQHNPIFESDGTISVFNNNAFLLELEDGESAPLDIELNSEILRIDPRTDVVTVAYGAAEGQKFGSVIRGRHEITPAGGFIISEFEGGRVFETDKTGAVVWEYINRFDDERVAEVTGAVVYPPAFFEVSDWRCPETAR